MSRNSTRYFLALSLIVSGLASGGILDEINRPTISTSDMAALRDGANVCYMRITGEFRQMEIYSPWINRQGRTLQMATKQGENWRMTFYVAGGSISKLEDMAGALHNEARNAAVVTCTTDSGGRIVSYSKRYAKLLGESANDFSLGAPNL